jgi:hypothetical protein
MSRKKIVAVTMVAAALGLGFAGYTVTRASGTDEPSKHTSQFRPKSSAGYRANHQIGHSGGVFAWMDAEAALNPPLHPQLDEPRIDPGSALRGSKIDPDDAGLVPVGLKHASKVGHDFGGFGLEGGGGGLPKGADEGSGERYANRYVFGGFAGSIGSTFAGGAPRNDSTGGASGSNDPADNTPHHDAPSASDADPDDQPADTHDQPGSADPPTDGPPAVAPPVQNPDPEEQQADPVDPTDSTDLTDPTGSTDPTDPTNIDPQEGDPGYPNEHYPPGNGNPPGEQKPVSVPEPGTLGLLGFGMIAAAALRRRRLT